MAASHCHAMHDEGEVVILCGWHAPTRIQPPLVLVLFVLVMSELKQLLNLQSVNSREFFCNLTDVVVVVVVAAAIIREGSDC
jgi:hypothetical protein